MATEVAIISVNQLRAAMHQICRPPGVVLVHQILSSRPPKCCPQNDQPPGVVHEIWSATTRCCPPNIIVPSTQMLSTKFDQPPGVVHEIWSATTRCCPPNIIVPFTQMLSTKFDQPPPVVVLHQILSSRPPNAIHQFLSATRYYPPNIIVPSTKPYQLAASLGKSLMPLFKQWCWCLRCPCLSACLPALLSYLIIVFAKCFASRRQFSISLWTKSR
jgi:hypothetical protein